MKPKKTNHHERVALYWDGSNFYHKLKDLNFPKNQSFNYRNFANWLANRRKIISNRFYIGEVKAGKKDKKGQLLEKGQKKFFYELDKMHFKIIKGNLIKAAGVFYEKGTDVEIATDLVEGAREDYYDTAILISSDADMIPAIKKAQNLNKKVEYIGFKNFPNFHLIKTADKKRLFSKKELQKFYSFKFAPNSKFKHQKVKQIKKTNKAIQKIQKIFPLFKKRETYRKKRTYL